MSVVTLLALPLAVLGQGTGVLDSASARVDRKKLQTFAVVFATGYTASMTGLYQLWYRNTPHQPFTFFNDNAEWKQVDKTGHALSAFYAAYTTAEALRVCNMPPRKADLYGALTAFGILLPVEIFDGYSKAYGASVGDLAANAGGALLYVGQTSLWNAVRIYPKISAHHTGFAPRRPDVLGESDVSRLLKDYNGLTAWLSVDMDKFVRFPRWLNLAVGYGAQGMLYGRDGQNREIGLDPKRQYYVALDLDLTSIKTRSKFLKALLFAGNMVKIPAPTVEFSSGSARFHALYF